MELHVPLYFLPLYFVYHGTLTNIFTFTIPSVIVI